MCDPTMAFALSSSMGIMQSVAGYKQVSDQADAFDAYNSQLNAMNHQNALSAYQAYDHSINQLGLRQTQERAASIDQLMDSQRLAMQAKSSAKVRSLGRSIGGHSIAGLMRDIEGQKGRHQRGLKANARNTSHQLSQEMKGARSTAINRANNRTPLQPVTRPSLLSTGLGIGGSLLNSYSHYKM